MSEDTRDPSPPKEGELSTQPEDVEEGEVVEIVTTTGDVDVVEEESHFTSESDQILIGEIMGCNRDLENIKENINDVQQKMKNIIDVLNYFKSQILKMHTVCKHMLSAITGYQCTRFVGANPFSQLK
ncbi:hypothetical protein AB205_0051690 [Aquarana catesbeiana]|uniref:Uncharacterized protein n=1 Tax=Aquarana catesbeiana TaxID=8400 RepID=A0A2G9R9I6_AQUCT|nr:hypothetical protein AB205_0051690 [Aquarana catesbeiana]